MTLQGSYDVFQFDSASKQGIPLSFHVGRLGEDIPHRRVMGCLGLLGLLGMTKESLLELDRECLAPLCSLGQLSQFVLQLFLGLLQCSGQSIALLKQERHLLLLVTLHSCFKTANRREQFHLRGSGFLEELFRSLCLQLGSALFCMWIQCILLPRQPCLYL